MGWICNQCKNTEDFTELNTVKTKVTQEKDSTRILRIRDSRTAEGVTNVWCNKCDSEDVSWIDVPDQDDRYMSD